MTVIVAVALAAPLPAAAQTLLDQLIQKIGKNRKGAPAASVTGGRFSAAITPAQTAAIDALIAQPISDARIAADRTEAAALIATVLATGSCAQVSSAWNIVNRVHMTPKTWTHPFGTEYVPMAGMKYHDASRCLTVTRLTDWSKPANNVLRFRAFYLADDSGEAKGQSFELQKGTDGRWLIRDIGSAL